MFAKIMAPVDLGHVSRLEKAIDVATNLAERFGAELTFVGVTANVPTPVAHNPAEFEQKLHAFAASKAEACGIKASAKAYVAHDPAADIDQILLRAVDETGADLVVMASHIPNLADAIWPAHGGSLASHASISVFLVRSS